MIEWVHPSLVKMQFQVAVITPGYKARDYCRKFSGHLIQRTDLQDYSPADHKKAVVMSTGTVNWKDFLDADKVGGLQYIFVVMRLIQRLRRDAKVR